MVLVAMGGLAMKANLRMPLDRLTAAQVERRLEMALKYPLPKQVWDGPPIGWMIAGILWTLAALVWAMARPA